MQHLSSAHGREHGRHDSENVERELKSKTPHVMVVAHWESFFIFFLFCGYDDNIFFLELYSIQALCICQWTGKQLKFI
jgi:hypothetical protein